MSDEIREALEKVFSADSTVYQQRGFQRRVGFGERPALINIDLANAWTRPGNPFTCGGMDTIIPGVQLLLAAARAKSVPVIYTTTAYAVTDPDGAAAVVVDRLPGLVLERLVGRDAPEEEAHDVVALVELRAEAGRMPRRAARQLVLLEQQRVRPAEPRQVVEQRAAGDTAADHGQPCFREHRWDHPNV